MRLINIGRLVLFVASVWTSMLPNPVIAEPPKDEEEVLQVLVDLFRGRKEVKLTLVKEKYQSYLSDNEFRTQTSSDWKILVRDKRGKVLDSAFIVLKTRNPGLPDGRLTSDVGEVEHEIYEAGYLIFKKHPSAHLVEVRFKGKPRASKKIDEAFGNSPALRPKAKP